MSTLSKARKNEVVEAAVKFIKESPLPVSISKAAEHLGMNWSTTRTLLFQLNMQDRIEALFTTSGWIFYAKKDELKAK